MAFTLLAAPIFVAMLQMTFVTAGPGFSMKYYYGSKGPYSINIQDTDLMRAFEDMCDMRTFVYNRTFDVQTGSTVSFKVKRLEDEIDVLPNVFSCQHKDTYTLSCNRMNQTKCFNGQNYYEFRSIQPTRADCRCIGICYSVDFAEIPDNDYFIKKLDGTSQCEDRLPKSTPKPPEDGDYDMDPNHDEFRRDDRRVDAHIPIIIGTVLGVAVLCLIVIVIILILKLRRVNRMQQGKPMVGPCVMYAEPEKKPISTMEYPPMYADVVKMAPPPNVDAVKLAPQLPSKTDLVNQSAPETYI